MSAARVLYYIGYSVWYIEKIILYSERTICRMSGTIIIVFKILYNENLLLSHMTSRNPSFIRCHIVTHAFRSIHFSETSIRCCFWSNASSRGIHLELTLFEPKCSCTIWSTHLEPQLPRSSISRHSESFCTLFLCFIWVYFILFWVMRISRLKYFNPGLAVSLEMNHSIAAPSL